MNKFTFIFGAKRQYSKEKENDNQDGNNAINSSTEAPDTSETSPPSKLTTPALNFFKLERSLPINVLTYLRPPLSEALEDLREDKDPVCLSLIRHCTISRC